MSRAKTIALCIAATLSLAALALPAGASAESECQPSPPAFGLCELDMQVKGPPPESAPALLAGTHPFEIDTSLAINTAEGPAGRQLPVEDTKDLRIFLPAGLVANPTAVPQCSVADFLAGANVGECADASAIGITTIEVIEPGLTQTVPVFNLVPPPGKVAKIGFNVLARAPVTIDLGLSQTPPYNGVASASNISQAAAFYSSQTTLWGVPADPAHDSKRGRCVALGGSCSVDEVITSKPLITLPTACEGPLQTLFEADSWQHPGQWTPPTSLLTHDDSIPPAPLGLGGCDRLTFSPDVSAKPSTDQAESPAGLDFELNVDDEGLLSPKAGATSQSTIKKAVVALPAGVTINPAVAEGLATCTPAQLDAETLEAAPGQGCPQASKVGSLEVQTPLLEEKVLGGSLYVASQDDPATAQPGAENPFDSLIALYLVVKDPELGILIKLPMRVAPDESKGPDTGRLVATLGEAGHEIPQVAQVSHFRLHLREGGRSPLITPATCGTYTTEATLTPWASPATPLHKFSSFQITRGPGGGPCPPAGTPPFKPGFSAGTINNDAKSYSPFDMRISRGDGEQDITKLSAKLPPGVLGSIVGVQKCSDAQIAAAAQKSGHEEIAQPSCPASAQIGRTLTGAGVGSQLTYVGGRLYLAGPYRGDPLSVVAIVPAVAGPFDIGNVTVRFAMNLNPDTLQVEVDGSASDPIPHVLRGIVLKVKDLRAYVDRDRFIFNPTNCSALEASATLFGSAANVFDPADDVGVPVADRFQAANCASLPFKPKISLALHGGTRRGDHPALKAVVSPRAPDANFARAVVTLPHSAFLDQGHIRTICTRVQFAAKACPAGAVYGHARAWSPLVEGAAEGPVYLRSSNHKLPDLVAALRGPPSAEVDFNLLGRIDSHKGGIRSSFESLPDVPVSRFVLRMRGGQKGLIVNSRNLCIHRSRAKIQLAGQNSREHDFSPIVRAGCKG